ncbi:hypothetical protein ACFQGT_13855 [Natrialbaceae archaeon GCM10025810]|uniref:hypothetical protein n=1 Tax=Halovalidus salilacus TaxID=3075124 RepID=UPI0036184B8C
MALSKLLRSPGTRLLTVGSLFVEAKRAFERGNRARAAGLAVLAVLSWKFALIGLGAQGILKLVRSAGGGRTPADG